MVSSTLKSGQEIETKIIESTTSSFGVYFVGENLTCEFPGYKEK